MYVSPKIERNARSIRREESKKNDGRCEEGIIRRRKLASPLSRDWGSFSYYVMQNFLILDPLPPPRHNFCMENFELLYGA